MADSSVVAEAVPAIMAGIAVLGVVGQGLVSAFRAGRHSQRLDRAETDILQLGVKVEGIGSVQVALATLAGSVSSLEKELGRVAHDVQAALRARE